MDETYVFIDGKYLSLISKHFGNGKYLNVDLNQFAITIAKTMGLWCSGVYYYNAPPFQHSPPTQDEMTRRSKHDKYVETLRRIPNFIVREGRCQKVDGEYHQKGVDTLLIMDLVIEVPKNKKIKKIIIVACDTDFVPILNNLRESGVEVILFYFSDFVRGSIFSMSNHLFTACDKQILIEKEHFDRSLLQK